MKKRLGHVTYINPSFHFKKLAIPLFTVGCLFGVSGCGEKQIDKEEKQERPIVIEINEEDGLEEYIHMGESENPLKIMIVENGTLEPLHFGYFRSEKEIKDNNEIVYKAYFDDVLTKETIDLGKQEEENQNIRYYYQLASRYFPFQIADDQIQKRVLQNFIDRNSNQLVTKGEYYHTFANYDVYPITADEIARFVVAGSLYSNEVEENRNVR